MKKNDAEIEEIIIDYLTDQADDERIEKLNAWLARSGENRHRFEMLRSVWQERSAEPRPIHGRDTLDKIWAAGVENTPVQTGKPRTFSTYLPKIAAVFVLFVLVPLLVFFMLRLQNSAPADVTYIVKENPPSQRSRFMLPDGSMVWLHGNSSLRYPEKFSTRQVELSGEAFFEVKEDPSRPFTVYAGDLSTTVLGTAFNVAAYPQKPMIEVALITGKVKVNKKDRRDELAVLDPGMGLQYDKTEKTATQQPVDADKVLAWKSGVLLFDGDDFEEFKWKMEQWYGVQVQVKGTVPVDWQIRGRFENEYLPNVLDIVSFSKDFRYQLDQQQLTLYFDEDR